MPNWCVNQVEITGDESEVVRLIELVKGEEDGFDFAKIVPKPDSKFYAITDGQGDFQCGCQPEFVITREMVKGSEGHEYDEAFGFVPQEGYWAVDGVKVEKEVLGNGTIKAMTDAAFGGSEVCPIHKQPKNSAHPDWWYNWNCANWGTKWNANEVWHDRADNDQTFPGRTSYGFDTAWSPAEPVILALSEKFPTLTIEHRYCEGGMGYAGGVMYRDGVEISRQEYSSEYDNLPDDAWLTEEDGSRGYERDYDKVPMTAFESFCDEHFGGVVGG